MDSIIINTVIKNSYSLICVLVCHSQAGITVTSAVTMHAIPRLAKAPRIKPHGRARYCIEKTIKQTAACQQAIIAVNEVIRVYRSSAKLIVKRSVTTGDTKYLNNK